MRALWILLALVTATPAFARPYTLVLMATPATAKRALALKDEIKKFDPFRRMRREDFVIKIAIQKDMGCEKELTASGTLPCDTERLQRIGTGKPYGGDHVMALPGGKFRASAGTVGILDERDSVEVVVHEFMHLHGFADEYDYDAASPDQKAVCDSIRASAPNTALVTRKEHYRDRSDVVQTHKDQIPWMPLILESTKLQKIDLSLGTPTALFVAQEIGNPNSPGIYLGGDCKGKTLIRPFESTIMRDTCGTGISGGIFPELYKAKLVESMEKPLGRRMRLEPPLEPECHGRWDMDSIEQVPELARLQEKLRYRLDDVLPVPTYRIPYDLFKIFPKLRNVELFAAENPECMRQAHWTQDEDGTWVDDSGSCFSGDCTPDRRNPNPIYLSDRLQGIKLSYQSLYLRLTNQTAEVCQQKARQSLPKIFEIDQDVSEIFEHPLIQAAIARASGLGEPMFAEMSEAISTYNPKRDQLVRALLGMDLYDEYRTALLKYHPSSPEFSCSQRWADLQKSRGAAAASRSRASAAPVPRQCCASSSRPRWLRARSWRPVDSLSLCWDGSPAPRLSPANPLRAS